MWWRNNIVFWLSSSSEHPLLIKVMKICSNLLWPSSILLEFEFMREFHTPPWRWGCVRWALPLGANLNSLLVTEKVCVAWHKKSFQSDLNSSSAGRDKTNLNLSPTHPRGTISHQAPELSHMLNLFCVKESLVDGDACSLCASCVSSWQDYLLFCNTMHAHNFRTMLLLLTE